MTDVVAVEVDLLLVATETSAEVLELPPEIALLEIAQQGLPGPQGLPGQGGISYVSYLAAGPISGHRVVCANFGGTVRYADSAEASDAALVLGISLNAASNGDSVGVATSGEIVEPSWTWVLGLPVFAGANGALTQTAPLVGFQLVVAVATSATSVLVSIKESITLI